MTVLEEGGFIGETLLEEGIHVRMVNDKQRRENRLLRPRAFSAKI